jgi:ABC-type oligopeptide transport system substrate-binding subunit
MPAMRGWGTRAAVLAALAGPWVACGPGKPQPPKRETVLPLLQREAESLKADGEKVNPDLGVKTTWTIAAVEANPRANDEAQPWAGTIRFKIESQMREVDGSVLRQEFEKRFDYVYSMTLNKWIIQYTPPTPGPRPS